MYIDYVLLDRLFNSNNKIATCFSQINIFFCTHIHTPTCMCYFEKLYSALAHASVSTSVERECG